MKEILLGYEIGTGRQVSIPFHHCVVTGVTSLSGKTTTLEALISRAGTRAIAFRTKRGEADFAGARPHAPYYRERSDWQYVAMLLEATMREKMRFERSWIIKVSKGTHGLRDVLDNVKVAKRTARGLNESVYTNLEAYLEIVVPQIESAGIVRELSLEDGVTVMDLEGMSDEMQSLIIASTLERVQEAERDLIVVIPEAWKYCPEGRGNPVKRVAEKLIRQGAAMRLFLWFDSQDLAGVDKALLKQVDNWILGRQREINEVEHTLAQVPVPRRQKPPPDEVMQLGVGQFFACYGDRVEKVYVRPAWLGQDPAIAVALGQMTANQAWADYYRPPVKEGVNALDRQLKDEYEKRIQTLTDALEQKEKAYSKLLGSSVFSAREKLEHENTALKRTVAEQDAELAKLRTAIAVGPVPPKTEWRDTQKPSGNAATGPLRIEALEREAIVTVQADPRDFSTQTVKGKILYVLLRDLNNAPAAETDIGAAMAERGWNYPHNTMAPELAKLVKNGDLIQDGQRPAHYRVPGKVTLTVRGEAPAKAKRGDQTWTVEDIS